MKIPQFKDDKAQLFNKKVDLLKLGAVDYASRMGLYVSKALLFIGLFLIVLENASYVGGGDGYFGEYNLVTGSVFIIGIILSFVSIPYLYISSFKKFKNQDDFWDQEMFWILPIFFFATFFQYGSGVYFMVATLVMSIFIIFVIHARFMLLSHGIMNRNGDYEKHRQYFESMKYLTVYYFLLILLYVFLNPIKMMHSTLGYIL